MTDIIDPFPYFPEAGTGGYIYVGSAGLDARTNPITVYRDAAQTLAWAQPIRTVNGYPAYQGAKAGIYSAASTVSLTVLDDNSRVVTNGISFADTLRADLASTASGEGASLVGTTLGITQQNVDDSLIMQAPWLGAAGDGTDCTAVVNAYLATKTRLHFPARVGTRATSRYGITGPLLVKQSGTHISFDKGARLVRGGASDPGSCIRVEGDAPTSFTNLSADAAEGSNTITTATDPGWAVGDWVEIRSETLITGCPNVAGPNKLGVGRKITKRTGTGPVTFSLDQALPYTFLTSDTAKAGKCTMIENVIIDCAQINDENFGTNIMSFPIYLKYCTNVTLINPTAFGSKLPYAADIPTGDFIKIWNVVNLEVRNPFMRHGGYYGLSILGWSENIRSYGGVMEDLRHAVSLVQVDPAFGDPYGQPINVLIDGMTANYTTLSSFDTHDTGRDVVFRGCVAYAAGDDGFQGRTTNILYDGCIAQDCNFDGFSQDFFPGAVTFASGLRAVNCQAVGNGRYGVNWGDAWGHWVNGRIENNRSAGARGGSKAGGLGAVMHSGLIENTSITDNAGTTAIQHGSIAATFTATIDDGSGGSGTVMTVAAAPSGVIKLGSVITGAGVTAGTTIVSQSSGTTGGVGSYVVSIGQLVTPAVTITSLDGQGSLLVKNCRAPASATQTSFVGTVPPYNLGLSVLVDNEVTGYGNLFFQNSGTTNSISPVTSGNQIATTGTLRKGRATLVAGTVTVANTVVRNKAAAAFGEAILSTIRVRRVTPGGTIGSLSVGSITDLTSFTIISSNALDTSIVEWDMTL